MKFLNYFFNILYPPLCLHCEERLKKQSKLFCPTCLSQLVPIDVQGRCPLCFGEDVVCKRCISRPVAVKRSSAVFSHYGAAFTLCSYLKRGNTCFLSAAASLMLLQFSNLDWPIPDLITPLPISVWERCKRGSNISALLAKQLAVLLNCSYEGVANVRSPNFAREASVATPSYHTVLRACFDKRAFLEEAEMGTRSIVIQRKKNWICDRRVLLIALQYDDARFRQAAFSLQEAGATEIYALALTMQ